MADGAAPIISAKEAIALGRQYFDELMGGQATARVLLEGLSIDEVSGHWVVTIGFDSERARPKRSLIGGSAAALMVDAMEQTSAKFQDFEIIREFRAVHLSSTDGSFVKLDHV